MDPQFWRYPRTSMMPCQTSARLILWEPSSPLGLQTKNSVRVPPRVKNPRFHQAPAPRRHQQHSFFAHVIEIHIIHHILQIDGINRRSWREKGEKPAITRVFGVLKIHSGHIPGLRIADLRPILWGQLLMPDLHAQRGFIPEK